MTEYTESIIALFDATQDKLRWSALSKLYVDQFNWRVIYSETERF